MFECYLQLMLNVTEEVVDLESLRECGTRAMLALVNFAR